MRRRSKNSRWIGGLAEWTVGDTVYLSVAFTWLLDEAWRRAIFARACGKRVVLGGPAIFNVKMRHIVSEVAEIPTKVVVREGKEVVVPGDLDDAIFRHNALATFASRGCPVGCYFCIVPKMEGATFTLLPDFPVRPVLCDNNLSALPGDYQDHIIARYRAEGVKLVDANSGFEPLTFTDEVYRRWRSLIAEGGGPWRFAYDETGERDAVLRVMKMLRAEKPKHKRVYVLVGNEPFAESKRRVDEVIENGCEPHVQAYMKLVAVEKTPDVRFDWTEQRLRNLERWANRRIWRKTPFEDYDRHHKFHAAAEVFDAQQGLFV